MAEKKQFQSVLDFRPQFENIIDALVPDIQFSYSAIMNNSSIQTYFNMISMEYYGYEYFQLLRLNKLEFKISERVLNLTILEIVYNIVTQIVARKWRYSEYIAYDMYILPLRIKKYISAMNYKFIEADLADKKTVLKLVSRGSRVIIEEIEEQYHDDRLNNIISQFRAATPQDVETRLRLFHSLALFLRAGEAIVFQKFGVDFATNYFKEVSLLESYKPSDLSDKEKRHTSRVIEDLFHVAIVVILLMSDAMKLGIWSKIKAAEKRRLELELTQKSIEEANRKILAIKQEDEAFKKAQDVETKKNKQNVLELKKKIK
ncbi:hypothetical protein SGLAD_v1c03260 [Spiroplasma gladiatoris]|uniref:Uncharacterized protein n=1 Tax=Spiroplasma gladiatoris TaxID=2143 RepID=A0A4P7AGK5_9MOLU|nr:hypothetical protein [Spiroplasma gladiatoris]QBQ07525.1 hypothetical protein SGLAD_v1c03260 [Spiroplasma gladiatoris]